MTFWTIISLILKFYLAGIVIALLRLGLHMIFRFDRFSWLNCKEEIWLTFIFTSVFWPLLLIQKEYLICPDELFDNGIAKEKRTLHGLRVNPPPCGNTIYFRSKKVAYSEETFGDFTFFAGDIEDYLVSRIEEKHCPAREESLDILNWIKHRSGKITEPCYVPEAWHIFGHHASQMLSEGHGHVFCTKCCVHYHNHALILNEDCSSKLYFYAYLDCPEGHHLIVAQAFHIMHTRDTIL